MNKLPKFTLPITILVASIILGWSMYSGIIEKQNSINEQEKKESCIRNSNERLEKIKSRTNEDQNLIINATWNYSTADAICYYIESQVLISSYGTVNSKYIYNLNTNQQLHYSLTNENGNIGGISKESIDKIEADILKTTK